MKKKYWLPALIFAALGILTYRFVFGYSFSGLVMLGLSALFLLFGLMNVLKNRLPRLMRFLHTALWVIVILLFAASAVTGFLIVRTGSGAEDDSSDYVIVLGAGVNGKEPSRSLRERLIAAEDYLRKYPDAVAILSGGQGDHEEISEALCMFNWLTERGIPAEQLRMEDQATSTEENIRYSLDLIEAETGTRPTKCAVLSSSYHLYRASLLAQKEGLEMIAVPAKCSHLYYCNMLLREICGVWYILVFG